MRKNPTRNSAINFRLLIRELHIIASDLKEEIKGYKTKKASVIVGVRTSRVTSFVNLPSLSIT
jgi:hypothetical protein